MKIIILLFFFISFVMSNEQQKIILDTSLLPPLNVKTFEAKTKSDQLLKNKRLLKKTN